ncbi:MAG TPA: VOC family protein [Candidatus Binataceae bacterium]|jgi:catechol-2,3-dioxygenase|nr:VOC family protein [Candidatus Binataceae bacterium]
MATPSIARLGHVGLHVQDLEKQKSFYRDILGLTVSDEDPELGMVFMSSRPDEEHHELLLCRGRNVGSDARVVQQVSFRCNSLEDVLGFYRRFKEKGVQIDVILSHGNAIGVYGLDPEGNRFEVYWNTGLKAKQPYGQVLDLEKPAVELMKEVEESVARYGKTGYIDRARLARQNIAPSSEK